VRVGRGLLRGSLAATVIVALVAGSGASAQRAHTGGERVGALSAQDPACTATRIRGFTDNRTGHSLQLLQLSYGLHDVWCDEPEDEIRPRSSDRSWLVGDTQGSVSVFLRYRLENGDEIGFTATLRMPDGTKAGCSFSDAGPRRTDYECLAEVVAGASEVAFVKFIVRPRADG
jgi:hypothetical protein